MDARPGAAHPSAWAYAGGSLLCYLAFLAFHPAFSMVRNFRFLELTEWTKAALWRPPQHELAGIWHYLSDHPHERGWLFAGIVGFLFLLHALSVRCARSGVGFSVKAIVIWFLVFSAPLVAALPVLSTDVLAYIVTGEVADQGVDPFDVALGQYRDSEAARYLVRVNHGSIYGPLATRLFQLLHFDGLPLLAKVNVFRTFSILALVACVLLLVSALRASGRDEREVRAAAVAFAWSPLVLLEGAMNGHVDVVIALLLSGGLALLARGHGFWGLAVLAATASVKVVCLFMLPAMLAFAYHQGGGGLSGIRRGAALASWTLAVFFVWLLPDWTGANVLEPVSAVEHRTCNSLTYALQVATSEWGFRALHVRWAGRALFAAVILWGVWNVRTPERLVARLSRDWLLYLLFFVPWMHPWYLIPGFVPVLMSRSRAHWITLCVLCVTFSVAYYTPRIGGSLETRSDWLDAYLLGVLPPSLLFLFLSRRRRAL